METFGQLYGYAPLKNALIKVYRANLNAKDSKGLFRLKTRFLRATFSLNFSFVVVPFIVSTVKMQII